MPANLNNIFPLKFRPFLSTLTANLKKLDSLALSWFGCCNVQKMNAMPRLLYLLQSLPVKLPQTFFHAVCSAFTKFLWRGKHPRIGRALLLRLKLRGGIGFPDPALYYTATHMTQVVDWCRRGDLKLWVTLEQEVAHAPLTGLLWAGKQLTSHLTTHPLIRPILFKMERFFRLSSLTSFPSPMTPLVGHLKFPPGLSDSPLQGRP